LLSLLKKVKVAKNMFVFIIWFLLLFILGDTYLGMYLFGFFSILSLVFLIKKKIIFNNQYVWVLYAQIFFLIFTFISLIFSTNLPLSIYQLLFYLHSFSIFWFFLFFRLGKREKESFLLSLLLIPLVLLVISIFFRFNPNSALVIPGMNLLHATYGHNHIAALLIMLLPIAWFYLFKNMSKFLIFIIVLLSFGLLFSFGRIAVFVGFVELLIIIFFHRKKILKNKIIKKLFIFIFGFFSLVLIVQILFSLNLVDDLCPTQFFSKQLCKPLKTEMRPKYWSRSLKTVKKYPGFGSGPGTYSLAEKKYLDKPGSGTAFAHNSFLQVGAEEGIIGGVLFVFLMFYLLFLAISENIKKKSNINWYISLGLVASYLNTLFDFDWSFIGIFVLTQIFLAMILKTQRVSDHQSNNSLIKSYYLTINFLLSLLILIFVVIDGLIIFGKDKLAFQTFPFFHWHSFIFLDSDKLNVEDKNQLYNIYSNNPSFVYKYLENKNDKNIYYWQLFEVQPMKIVNIDFNDDFYQYQLDRSNYSLLFDFIKLKQETNPWTKWKQWKKLSNILNEFINKSVDKDLEKANDIANLWFETWNVLGGEKENLDFYYREKLSLALVDIGNRSINKEMFVVGQNYQNALLVDEWVFTKEIDWLEKTNFKEINILEFKGYVSDFKSFDQPVVGIELNNKIRAYQLLANYYVERKEWEIVEEYLSRLKKAGNGDYWVEVQLGNFYVLKGDMDKAKDEFWECLINRNNHHSDCENGLKAIENDWDKSNRYWEVSQIILKEKNWSDF
jgi:O-antigen ligase